MTLQTAEEIAQKIVSLDLWGALEPYNVAVKPFGTVFPYFCAVVIEKNSPIKARLMMLEGWQTMHDFIRTRLDHNFGFYSSPIEFPHFELIVEVTGKIHLLRNDPGYMPQPLSTAQNSLVARILWELYGVFLRLESDPQLPMRFVEERGIFARIEVKKEVWEDRALTIADPPPHVEKVSFAKADLSRAKDIPFVKEDVLHVDFALMPDRMTSEKRPRLIYRLVAFDPKTKELPIDMTASMSLDSGLRGLWEEMPRQFLKRMIERGRIPGEVKVVSGRVFRLLRPLCFDLPFKLSLHDHLEFE